MPLLVTSLIMSAVVILSAQEADKKYDILLLSGAVHPSENTKGASSFKFLQDEVINGKYYRIMQFKEIPSDPEKQELQSMGIELLVYLPNYAFYASVSQSADLSKANKNGNIRAILQVSPEYKIHPSLTNNKLPKEAELVKGKADIVLIYFKDIPAGMIANELKKKIKGIKILSQDDASQTVNVRVKRNQVNKLSQLFFIQYVEPVEPFTLENNSGTSEHRSNTINSYMVSGLHYDGSGVGVSIGDGGEYFTHVDFEGRQIGGLSTGAADHGTHVAGILAGAGNINPRYRGHAPGANLIYSNGFADISSVAALTALYNGTDKIRVTNHSLGEAVNAGYTSTARMSDLEVESLPSMFNVHSCGNSGTAWSTITGGYKSGKNAIAAGALDYKDLITSYSSRGPSKDGRIKPDICTKGDNVMSTYPNNVYNTMSGTSMASPATAGCFSQLIHAYRDLNSGNDPKLAQLKAIVLNTAEDLGNAGPDYTYGWGRINVWKAYNAIKDQRYFSSTIANGATNTHVITVPANVTEMKVMVYWADPAAAAGVTKALINDLDITVSAATLTYKPWELDFLNPGTAAIKGTDNDNNMEQVSVLNPATGTYTLNVAGTLVPQGPQEYWGTYEFITDSITVTYPMGGESLVPAETEYIRWDAQGTTGNFLVEYSADGGTTWSTLSSTVAGTARYYSWVVPSGITSQALIRVSRNGKSDVSDNGFNIIPVPTNLQIISRCPSNFEMSWNAVTGATRYEVFAMGTKYMVSQGTTAWLSWIVNIPNTSIIWASVRALANNGQVIGRRAVAIQVGTSTANCSATSIFETDANAPYGLAVYPNPISNSSIITTFLSEEDVVSVKLIDVMGKEVASLADNQKLSVGKHNFTFEKLPANGIYFIKIQGSKGFSAGKIIVDEE